ncbi:MAG: hypothetical protein OXU77_01965 [Gammaproteobacteria bacterium]|nr:hypothetical protein [Gammaproteobacteria bacterium]MDE0443184.1 hypothetical protein [Gammaproteobacteria bacterium]
MTKRTTAGALVAAAVAVVVYLGLNVGERRLGPHDDATPLNETEKERIASTEARSQIAAESKAIDALASPAGNTAAVDDHPTSAPPGFVPAPPVDHDPTPPVGYSFTAFHEVARGPMTADDFDRDQAPADPPEWMALGEDALAKLAAASGRDWSFGWVKLAEGADLDALDAMLAAHGGEVLGRAGDLVRARLPGDASSLQAIAAAESVAGVGAVPPDRKVTETAS